MARADKPGDSATAEAGDFLARWSQRKLEARRENMPATDGDDETPRPAGEPGITTEPAEPARELTDADMPPLDSLNEDSDYSPFLSPGVSDGLRRLALRRLFSQPDFNITDGLNDYDEDYTQFAGLGNVISHEMKRMLAREQEQEQEQEQKQEEGAQPAQARDTKTVSTGNESPPEMPARQVISEEADDDSDDTGCVTGSDENRVS
jgi:hypothetical protein